MNPWLDGLSALQHHAGAVFVILLVVSWGIFVSRRTANFSLPAPQNPLTEADLFSISAAAWVVPVLFLALITFGASLLFNETIGGIFAAAIILVSAVLRTKAQDSKMDARAGQTVYEFSRIHEYLRRNSSIRGFYSWTVLNKAILITILILSSFILRFAILANLSLPAYFDSAAHYSLIRALTESYSAGILSDTLKGAYYHPGFHVIAASVSHFFHINIVEFMLVIGAIMLALLPIPFFFIVKRETDSNSAAFFACLLAGFGFHMPAHLMNWGKYPALMSLAAMLFVFDLVIVAYRGGINKKILFLLACAVFASALIHSRTLILYALIVIAALVTQGWSRLRVSHRRSGVLIAACIFAAEIIAISAQPAFKPLFDAYLTKDIWILILLIPLFIASAFHYPKPTFFIAALFVVVLACLLVPIRLPGYGVQTLLDRPFAQMFAFIPFSLIGGFGLASLTQTLRRLFPDLGLIQRFAPFLLFGLILLNAAVNYSFYPSACCRFATHDDLAAFAWLDRHLPPDATILIASSTLYVTPFEQSQPPTGVDAGIWIEPLLSRRTSFSGLGVQFNLADTHSGLCAKGLEYIYVGGMPQSFDSTQLDLYPNWYMPAFELPAAQIYQVIGCG
jgi:hypothetical protein